MRFGFVVAALLAASTPALAQDKPAAGKKAPAMRFWNLTGETVAKFELAPAGTTTFGPDQAKNDKDGTVDNDERLKIVGVEPGKYDARITDTKGRVCLAYGLDVKIDPPFSVEKDQLKDCKP